MRVIDNSAGLGITSKSRVLVFMPHPDDEAVFASGLLQKIAIKNPNIKVITASAGEQSTLRFGLKPNDDLALARKNELNTALSILGVSDHEIWNFPDMKLETNIISIKSKISKEIIHYQPTHLITLEPDGIYGHPDHIALSEAVTLMCPPSVKLLYVTVSPNYILPASKKMAKKAIIKPLMPSYKLNLTMRESIKKVRALQAHRSQFKIDLFHPKSLFFFLLNDMLFHEYFTYRKIES